MNGPICNYQPQKLEKIKVFPQIGESFFLKSNTRAWKSFFNQTTYVQKVWLLETIFLKLCFLNQDLFNQYLSKEGS